MDAGRQLATRPGPAAHAVFAGVVVALALSACELAPLDLEAERPLPLRSSIRAADGTLLTRLYRQNRELVGLNRVPGSLIDAVVATEDGRFFEHSGYDLRAIARAALANYEEGEVVQGGSTITQQYVKNTYFPKAPRTLERKARELRISLEIERRYSKPDILERYLNTVYFGSGAYGVKAAAHVYFGHGLGRMTVAEAALLAAVIKSPAHYDPRDHPRRARERRNYVLDRMVETGALTLARRDAHAAQPLGVLRTPPRVTSREPYFVEAVRREILSDRRLGISDGDRARALYKGGLEVTTTLDPDLQRGAERAADGILGAPGDPEVALIALRPETGEIVAMVGGRDWEASQVNLALGAAGGGSGRQPGSAFKPLALAAAMESGIPLDASYESSPVRFTFDDGSVWQVGNAEGGGYGLLPLDEALIHSVNGVYARLAMQIGGNLIATQAELMGIRSRLPSYPSIALGSAEVSVLDMATAYATLANYGTAVEPTTIKSIRFPGGRTLRPEQEIVPQAVAPGTAYLVTKTLEQVIQRGTGVAAAIGRPAAGKTGTTNDYADAWFVGYTPDLVTAVWVGYPQGRIPMTNVHGIRVMGGTFPAQIWRAFMVAAHEGVPISYFTAPRSEFVIVEIDPKSGLLAAPWCPGHPERMLRQLAPTEYCPQPAPEPTPTPTPDQKKPDKRDDEDKAEPDQDDKPKEPHEEPAPTPTPEPSPTESRA